MTKTFIDRVLRNGKNTPKHDNDRVSRANGYCYHLDDLGDALQNCEGKAKKLQKLRFVKKRGFRFREGSLYSITDIVQLWEKNSSINTVIFEDIKVTKALAEALGQGILRSVVPIDNFFFFYSIISSDIAELLGKYIKHMRVRRLFLDIKGDDHLEPLFQGFREAQTEDVKIFRVKCCKRRILSAFTLKNIRLKYISLESVKLSSESVACLGKTIESCYTLRSVSIVKAKRFGDKAITMLSKSLANRSSEASKNSISLCFDYCSYGNYGLFSFSKVLEEKVKCTYVSITGSKPNNITFQCFCASIERAGILRKLSVAWLRSINRSWDCFVLLVENLQSLEKVHYTAHSKRVKAGPLYFSKAFLIISQNRAKRKGNYRLSDGTNIRFV